jgi:hypothetical protein
MRKGNRPVTSLSVLEISGAHRGLWPRGPGVMKRKIYYTVSVTWKESDPLTIARNLSVLILTY